MKQIARIMALFLFFSCSSSAPEGDSTRANPSIEPTNDASTSNCNSPICAPDGCRLSKECQQTDGFETCHTDEYLCQICAPRVEEQTATRRAQCKEKTFEIGDSMLNPANGPPLAIGILNNTGFTACQIESWSVELSFEVREIDENTPETDVSVYFCKANGDKVGESHSRVLPSGIVDRVFLGFRLHFDQRLFEECDVVSGVCIETNNAEGQLIHDVRVKYDCPHAGCCSVDSPIACGNYCCPSGHTCSNELDGFCIPSGASVCGEGFCKSGFECLGDRNNKHCVPSGTNFCSSVFCPPAWNCGDETALQCCPPGTEQCGEVCCASGNTCETHNGKSFCIEPGQSICLNQAGRVAEICNVGQKCSEDSCLSGRRCQCIPESSSDCGNGRYCSAGEVCSGGRCCPNGTRNCNGSCCDGVCRQVGSVQTCIREGHEYCGLGWTCPPGETCNRVAGSGCVPSTWEECDETYCTSSEYCAEYDEDRFCCPNGRRPCANSLCCDAHEVCSVQYVLPRMSVIGAECLDNRDGDAEDCNGEGLWCDPDDPYRHICQRFGLGFNGYKWYCCPENRPNLCDSGAPAYQEYCCE